MNNQTQKKLYVLIILLSIGLISPLIPQRMFFLMTGLPSPVFLLIPACVISVLLFFEPQIKGWIGEWRVRRVLKRLENSGTRILYNVFLRLSDGKTTQIDHVAVSPAGVFVIETKTFQGWIFGSEKGEYWTQKIYRSNRKFKNPLHQNYGHVMALKSVLDGFGEIPYHPVVVFAGKAELKKVESPNVTTLPGLLPWMAARHAEILTPDQIEAIAGALRASKSASRQEMKQHIATIQMKVASAGKNCPKCGSALVERKGKYGAFIGCSRFPNCRYIYHGDTTQTHS